MVCLHDSLVMVFFVCLFLIGRALTFTQSPGHPTYPQQQAACRSELVYKDITTCLFCFWSLLKNAVYNTYRKRLSVDFNKFVWTLY